MAGADLWVVFTWFLSIHTFLYVSIVLYSRLTYMPCKSKAKMNGKTVIVTGATGGIGKETARDLAHRGARIILACRNVEAAEKVRDEFIQETGNSEIFVKKVDLSSMESVRDFAADVNSTEKKLDVLIHNAGVAHVTKRIVTKDGLDDTMATNHFGPFLLTHLLLDLLKKATRARIVVVASVLHHLVFPTFRAKHMTAINYWIPPFQYCYSKYINILFANELAMRLQDTGITVNSLHPGVIQTGIWRNLPFPLNILLYPYARGIFRTPTEGAQTTIYCAISEDVEGVTGKYFYHCKPENVKAGLKDRKAGKRMWDISENTVLQPSDPRIE